MKCAINDDDDFIGEHSMKEEKKRREGKPGQAIGEESDHLLLLLSGVNHKTTPPLTTASFKAKADRQITSEKKRMIQTERERRNNQQCEQQSHQ